MAEANILIMRAPVIPQEYLITIASGPNPHLVLPAGNVLENYMMRKIGFSSKWIFNLNKYQLLYLLFSA